MSHEHVRWAIRDILKDPKGPLKGAEAPEGISGGKIEPQAVLDLLSRCGIRRGAKEFFARVLENADEDAGLVDRHIGGYGAMEQNLAAKSLIRIILVNARDEKKRGAGGEGPDLEMEDALFACMHAAEGMRERDSRLALAFLEFCGSAAFGSNDLKKLARCCCRDDACETARFVRNAARENPDSVMTEFFLSLRQVACNVEEEYEVEGVLRHLFRNCCNIARECPGALYSFFYYFSNSSWEGIEEGLLYIGLFDHYGVLKAFAGMGGNGARAAELADEFFFIAKAAGRELREKGGIEPATVKTFLDALSVLGKEWPAAMVPFSRYFRSLIEDGRLDRVQALAESFTSEGNFRALEQLEGDLRMQLALMQACYAYALRTEAN